MSLPDIIIARRLPIQMTPAGLRSTLQNIGSTYRAEVPPAFPRTSTRRDLFIVLHVAVIDNQLEL
ncbi:hypothetical protein BS47DRAFT_1344223 [Hydnum rufescens UP504]|uniref:Uncharacterized protein n=1 Tax=Hydnum rufescens UP504 TaxID=1448309 RepID=A0A9P6AY00_9AGAM|nr:hypothetical protein BS47DRAFT_1344223 [Hydnum rufescens UP504]